MLEIYEALLLGIIQGLTEFLPVSSSGHLELGKALLGDESMPRESMLFTIVVHAATALATLLVYRSDVSNLIKGTFMSNSREEQIFSAQILLSMIPAVLLGMIFSDEIEIFFSQQITLVGSMLIVTAGLLLIADNPKESTKDVSFFSSLVIGLSQAIAILPGISRSGATISTAILLGINREKAAKFSFLMVVPLIIGKIIQDIISGEVFINESQIGILTVGFLSAFITGIYACKIMISIVKKAKLKFFAIYCFVVGSISILTQI